MGLLAGTASAIPPGGASVDTPGTRASVSPRTPAPGGTLNYRVSGFPAGEVVYLKIDDGSFCSQSGVHGACVVAQQRIPASGTVTGSVVLPDDLGAGAHWLRFLASEEVTGDDGSYLGTKGYTARGDSDFTVRPATASSPDPSTGSGASTSAPASASAGAPDAPARPETTVSEETLSAGAEVAPAGSVIAVTGMDQTGPVSASPEAGSTAGPSPSLSPEPGPTAGQAAATPVTAGADARFPWVGVGGLGALVALALLLVAHARRARG